MGFPLLLLSVREYRAHGQEEANNNAAGTTLNSAKLVKSVESIFFSVYKPRVLFLICYTASISISLFTRTAILSRFDPSNETFDYPRVNFLISFPLNRENCLQERGSATAGVKLIQQIRDGWIHSVQLLHNVGATTVSELVAEN